MELTNESLNNVLTGTPSYVDGTTSTNYFSCPFRLPCGQCRQTGFLCNYLGSPTVTYKDLGHTTATTFTTILNEGKIK